VTACRIEGCTGTYQAHGLCVKHYARLRRHGDPTITLQRGTKPTPLIDRLADKFLVGDECWSWVGARDDLGYGQIKGTEARRKEQAHRAVYELLVGPIPTGLHLDHLCNNPNCVRPDHLEPVTQAENNRRAHMRRHVERGGLSIEVIS
jgi:hypothetical protein